MEKIKEFKTVNVTVYLIDQQNEAGADRIMLSVILPIVLRVNCFIWSSLRELFC
jgi:hypothetical protein